MNDGVFLCLIVGITVKEVIYGFDEGTISGVTVLENGIRNGFEVEEESFDDSCGGGFFFAAWILIEFIKTMHNVAGYISLKS